MPRSRMSRSLVLYFTPRQPICGEWGFLLNHRRVSRVRLWISLDLNVCRGKEVPSAQSRLADRLERS